MRFGFEAISNSSAALQCEFEELGYENYRKTAPVRTTDPLGRCFDVWRGGFEDVEGRPLDGPLTVREPQDVEVGIIG